MITEQFLNSCFSVVLSKSNLKKDKSIYRDILEILSFFRKRESFQIPLNIRNKFDSLEKICEMKLNGKNNVNVLDSICSGGRFNEQELIDFLHTKSEQELDDRQLQDHINQIRLRKKLNTLFKNYDKINDLIDEFKSGSFSTIDDLVSNYEDTVKVMYAHMSECNRDIDVENTSSLDLKSDDYSPVIETIVKKYSNITKTPTGYSVFDNEVLGGGFEPSRIYMLAGGSGSGKSTLLNNIIVNSASSKVIQFNDLTDGPEEYDKPKVYLYITLENTIDESLLRTYQPLFNKTTSQVLDDINNNVDIKGSINKEFEKTNSNVIMKYFRPHSISSVDIRMILDDIKDQYPEAIIAGLFIDYLELIQPMIRYDLYRLDLGQIILDSKSIAVDYNIPVVMPTQLGRSSYRIDDINNLNLDQVGESIKKVENSDLVALQVRDPIQQDLVHMKIGKNRCGPANVGVQFKVNWQTYKFLSSFKPSDNSQENQIGSFDSVSPLSSSQQF